MRQVIIHAPDPRCLATGLSGITPQVLEEILRQASRWNLSPRLLVDARFASFYRGLDPRLLVHDSGLGQWIRAWVPRRRSPDPDTTSPLLWHVPWNTARWLPGGQSIPLLVSLPASGDCSPLEPGRGGGQRVDSSRLLGRASLFTTPEREGVDDDGRWPADLDPLGRPLLPLPSTDAGCAPRIAEQFLRLYDDIVESRVPHEFVEVPPRAAATGPHSVPSNTPIIGLVICTFNRPMLLRATLASLEVTCLPPGTVVAVVDDGSTDIETRRLVQSFALEHCPVHKIHRVANHRFGVHESLRIGWDFLDERYGLTYFVNLDSDTILRREWLVKSLELFQRESRGGARLLVTGFHSSRHRVLAVHDDHYRKETCGGIHMLFDAEFYRDVVRPNLRFNPLDQLGWDWRVVEVMRQRGYPVLCARPSVLQHMGVLGQFSKGRHWLSGKRRWDSADDFVPDEAARAGLCALHSSRRPEAA